MLVSFHWVTVDDDNILLINEVDCFSDDYGSVQSQSDAVKAESETLPTAPSLGPVTSNPGKGGELHVDDNMSSQAADDDEVLNLVKVKEPTEAAETESGTVTKEEEDDDNQKRDVQTSELMKSEASDEVKKEPEKDDEDTLSESETAAGVKQAVTAAVSADIVKDEAAVKLMQKDDADEEIDHSAVPSPCPEVR